MTVRLTRAVALLGLALAPMGVATAQTLTGAQFTADFTQSAGMTTFLLNGGGGVSFGHEHVHGATSTGVVSAAGTTTAQFHANPGLIFDKVSFLGIFGGIIANDQGAATSAIDWNVSGGTYTGPADGVVTDNVGRYRGWTITGPSTGSSFFYDGYWFQTIFPGPVSGSGYYSIGASDFSIDIDALVNVYNQGGRWESWIDPHSISFGFSFLDAPPEVNAAPEPATFALTLTGLCLLALTARRRKQMEAP